MRGMHGARRSWPWRLGTVIAAACFVVAAHPSGHALDRPASEWVEQTLAGMSVDEQVGQLLVPSLGSGFVSTDSDTFDRLARLVRECHVGGFHVLGGVEAAPAVLLNPAYRTVSFGQPLAVAALLNRLQALSRVPLLNTADFETGLGFRLDGATTFPREMALAAIAMADEADGVRAVRESARITAVEARAIGVHVNLAPVADVNSNPRNPVINTRSFGEDVDLAGRLAAAYVAGAREGGLIATLKHFPGHGGVDADSHLGLPIVSSPREQIDRIDLPPFRRGIEAGAEAVMVAHLQVPALDPAPSTPATFSAAIVDGVLRGRLGFQGLVYTDSMSMDAITKLVPPGEAAVRAVAAGVDQVLDPPDPGAAFDALRSAVASGRLSRDRLAKSVRRVLAVKASAGLTKSGTVDLGAIADQVGGRMHRMAAREDATRSVTLVRDERHEVPLAVPPDTPVLYLSVLDYPDNWLIAPGRTFIPELRRRFPRVTAIEFSDRTSSSELDLIRAMASRFGAIVAGVFVRTASGSGRMDLSPQPAKLLDEVDAIASRERIPFVTCVFGNPYTAARLPGTAAMLLTYDLGDLPELAAVRALVGDESIGGRLPISIPGVFPIGYGLTRAGATR
jgi:beta-N-acetylhexosaminidase